MPTRSVDANLRSNFFVLSFCEDPSFHELGGVVVWPSGDDGLSLRRRHAGQLPQILLGGLIDIKWPFSRQALDDAPRNCARTALSRGGCVRSMLLKGAGIVGVVATRQQQSAYR